MAGVTTGDDIAYTTDDDTFDPAAASASQASSVQSAMLHRQVYDYRWADSAARTAQIGMRAGDEGYQIDTGVTYKYNGSAWKGWHTTAPISYTPTWTNLTVGSATQSFTYTLAAGRVAVSGYIILSSSTVSGSPRFTLPLAANGFIAGPSAGNYRALGTAVFVDEATAVYSGRVLSIASGGVVYAAPYVDLASGTYSVPTPPSSTVPFTWANTDYMTFDFQYMAD